MNQVDAANHIAPLIISTGLKGATIATEKFEVVICLKDLVREFCVGDALVGGNTARNNILVEHGANTEVFTDSTQEINSAHLLRPIEVIHHSRCCGSLEVKKTRNLRTQTICPALNNFGGLELTLTTLTRIANLARCTTHECKRTVSRELQVTHNDQLNKVTMVK